MRYRPCLGVGEVVINQVPEEADEKQNTRQPFHPCPLPPPSTPTPNQTWLIGSQVAQAPALRWLSCEKRVMAKF